MSKTKQQLKSEILDLNYEWLKSQDFKEFSDSTSRRQDLLEKLSDRATKEAMFLPTRKGTVYKDKPPVLSHAIVLPTSPILAIRSSEYRIYTSHGHPIPDPVLRLMKDPMTLLDMDEMNLEHLEITHSHLTRPQRIGRQGIIAAGLSELNELISRFGSNDRLPIPA